MMCVVVGLYLLQSQSCSSPFHHFRNHPACCYALLAGCQMLLTIFVDVVGLCNHFYRLYMLMMMIVVGMVVEQQPSCVVRGLIVAVPALSRRRSGGCWSSTIEPAFQFAAHSHCLVHSTPYTNTTMTALLSR